MKQVSLKAKIISVLGIVLLLMCFLNIYLIERMGNATEDSNKSNFLEYASILNNSIQDQFYERYGDVQSFASTFAYVDAIQNKKIAVEYLNQYVKLYGIYDLIVMVDLKGNLIATNNISSGGHSIDTSSLKNKNFSGESWFRAVAENKLVEDPSKGFTGVFFEDAHFDPLVESVYGKTFFGTGFATYVKNSAGTPYAIITTRANFKWVEDSFKRLYEHLANSNQKDVEMTMLNSNGAVIVDYDPAINGGNKEVVHNKDILGKFNLAEQGVQAAQAAVKGQVGVIYSMHKRKNVEQMAAYMPVDGAKFIRNIGWSLLVRNDKKEVFANHIEFRNMSLLALLVVAAFTFLLAYFFSRSLAHLLNTIAERLVKSGDVVYNTSNSISASSANLSAAATEQAAALQETVAAVSEISAMVSRTADMASQSKSSAAQSKNAAEKGKKAVEDVIKSISNIKISNDEIINQVEESNKQISEIVKMIAEIGNKTKVINDIVFQTKLLSFNASVEAARAGEYGKGFAVVAEEVGNLAQMSGNSAKEISDLLDASTTKVKSIVDSTRQRVEKLVVVGREKVNVGEDTAKQCDIMLEQILTHAEQVNSFVTEIATSTEEQSKGVQEINAAMNQLDSVTQQNAVGANQASEDSGRLLAQSEDLAKIVTELKMIIDGNDLKKLPHKETKDPNKDNKVLKVNNKIIKFEKPEKKEIVKKKVEVAAAQKVTKQSNDNVVHAQITTDQIKSEQIPEDSYPSANDSRFQDL